LVSLPWRMFSLYLSHGLDPWFGSIKIQKCYSAVADLYDKISSPT